MGKVQKVVADTGIILSAFGRGGRPLAVMGLLERGEIRNCLSEPILNELTAALSCPALAFPPRTRSDILQFVLAWSDLYDPAALIVAAPDPADDKFIECADAADARVIITGDERFLPLRRYGRIRVLSPEDFLAARKKA